MKRGLMIGLVLFLIFIIGCGKELECPTCPECPKVECPSEKEVIKYVCSDDRVVDKKEDCKEKPVEEDKLYTPITTNEEGTYINSVIMKPGCYRGQNTAVISFDIGVLADKIRFQFKEDPSEDFKTLYEIDGINKGSRYIVICDNCKSGDSQIKANKQYLARIEFDLSSLFKTTQYSNEHIIDTRSTSDYMTKVCAE